MPGLISMSSTAALAECACGGGGGGGGGSVRASSGFCGVDGALCGVAGGGSDVGVPGDVVTSSRASEASSEGLGGSEPRRRFLGRGLRQVPPSSTALPSRSCSLFTSASPRTLSDSATLSSGPICSWLTLISPLYMNSTTALSSGHLMSLRITIGCWHGLSKKSAWK